MKEESVDAVCFERREREKNEEGKERHVEGITLGKRKERRRKMPAFVEKNRSMAKHLLKSHGQTEYPLRSENQGKNPPK